MAVSVLFKYHEKQEAHGQDTLEVSAAVVTTSFSKIVTLVRE